MASRSLNRVILIGNLTRDPELKYTPNGTAVCTFGVATNRSWTTADGQTKEEAQYHRIVAWQKLAELCGKLLTKGRKVYLEGRLVYRTFVGRDGQERTVAEIILDDFIVFNDGKKLVTNGTGDNLPVKEEKETQTTKKKEEKPTEEENIPTEEIENNQSETPTEEVTQTEENQDINPDDIPF
ncbi:MAG: single-stranded DNA-binding protein [Patescibacteria group bacterium]|nr:single-stranded DNA-binding protein [Patescibacteria group bacterium]